MRDVKSNELEQVYGGYGDYAKPLKHSFTIKGFKFKKGDHNCRVGNSTVHHK